MPKKSNSEGSIFYSKTRNRFTAQFYELDSKTEQNKRKTKDFKTEEEAKKYLRTIMYQKENPLYIEHNGIPFCEVMKSHLKLKLDTNQISSTQFARVSRTIQEIEKTTLGSKNIDEITSSEIQEHLNSIIHLSNSTIKKVYQQFTQTFKIAMNKGYIMQNPMTNEVGGQAV